MSTAATVQDAIPVLSSEERLAAAEHIVRKNMYCAAGLGCIPVPLVSILGVAGFQAAMVKQLSNVYGVKFNDHLTRNIVTTLLSTLTVRALTAGVVGSIFKMKFLPGVVAAISALLVVPAIAGAVTYAMGRVFIKHFEEGGTLLDLDVEKSKSFFQAQYKVGQKAAATPTPVAA